MDAIQQIDNVQITLIGNEEKLKGFLTDDKNISVIHSTEMITSEDEPVRAVRRKKDSSLVLMANEVKEGRADACISAGNTGALMSAGLFVVGRTPGIMRPALSPTLRSEEHTSELQSRGHLVCRLLLEKKNKKRREVNICKHNGIDIVK